MLKKRIRFIFILGAVFLLYAMLAGGFFSRVLCMFLIVYLLIFIIGRIGSKSDSRENKQTAGPETKESAAGSSQDIYEDDSDSEEVFTDSLQADIGEMTMAANGIRNSQIREKAFHVLMLAKDIIREHTEENNPCGSYSQFESYYIPTLKSVIQNYRVMENKGMASVKVQQDVLAYLESCDEAFTKLYNSMFEDDIMNMEVQMKAMNITLKRDGLL